MNTLRRPLHPEVRVLDEKTGLVEYVASDETLDSYREVIRAAGWRFDNFAKNAPFVDSHDYSSIDRLVGKVVAFETRGKKLVETVQWAKDVPGNLLAQRGWEMTRLGFLKAVSVGFWPVKQVSKWDADPTGYVQQLEELGHAELPPEQKPHTIYLEQQQVELSAVIIGANPNALARAYKAGVLNDADLDHFSTEHARQNSRTSAADAAHAEALRARQRQRLLDKIETLIKKI